MIRTDNEYNYQLELPARMMHGTCAEGGPILFHTYLSSACEPEPDLLELDGFCAAWLDDLESEKIRDIGLSINFPLALLTDAMLDDASVVSAAEQAAMDDRSRTVQPDWDTMQREVVVRYAAELQQELRRVTEWLAK